VDDARTPVLPPASVAVAGPKIDEVRAGLFMIAGAACFAVHFAVIKYLVIDLPQPVIALWRAIFAILLFSPRIMHSGWRIVATSRWGSHAWRSGFGFLSFLLFIYALGMLPLGDTVAITFSSPFWSVLIGIVVFHDRMTWRLALSLVFGFAGVLLIAQPSGGGGISLGVILALASAILGSFAMMMVKQLSRSEPPERIAFYFMVGGLVFAIPLCAFDWAWPAPHHWPYLVATGAMFYFGQYCLSSAYAYGTFSRVAPLDLTRLPVSVLIGLLWFAEIPTALALTGMALIVLASIDILLQGRKKPAA
jgi:drug/metabolite transporter (DMT)-like permease